MISRHGLSKVAPFDDHDVCLIGGDTLTIHASPPTLQIAQHAHRQTRSLVYILALPLPLPTAHRIIHAGNAAGCLPVGRVNKNGLVKSIFSSHKSSCKISHHFDNLKNDPHHSRHWAVKDAPMPTHVLKLLQTQCFHDKNALKACGDRNRMGRRRVWSFSSLSPIGVSDERAFVSLIRSVPHDEGGRR